MLTLEELLKSKIKTLESSIALKNKVIEQLEYERKHKQMAPVGQYLKPDLVFERAQKHAERLYTVNLEIENMELKEQLSILKGT